MALAIVASAGGALAQSAPQSDPQGGAVQGGHAGIGEQSTPSPSEPQPGPAASAPKDGVAVPDTTLDPSIAKAPPPTGAATPVIKPPINDPGAKTIVVPK